MGKKVMAAKEALSGGSGRVIVAGANVNDPIVAALGGAGTTIERSAIAETGRTEGETA